MMKSKYKILFYMFIVVNILLFTFISYGKSSKKDEKEVKEKKTFYSRVVRTEETNEGVKVVIEKTDKYGNDQDEYTSVNINVINQNPYADLDVSIEAIEHSDFNVITNKKLNYRINSDNEEELNFDYEYKNYNEPFKGDINKMKLMKPYHFKASTSITSRYEKELEDYTIIYPTYSEIKKEKEDETEKESNFLVLVLIILAIVIILAIFIAIFIIKYLRHNDDFYSMFLIILLSFLIGVISIINKTNAFAYSQQTFLYNTEYSHIYECTVYHRGIAYKLKYNIKYKFIGEEPIIDPTLDSDGDGLKDIDEYYFICDRYNSDTDNDGLSDYIEIYKTDTSPIKKDTYNDGINDGDRDYDKDKLTNIEEINLSTFPDYYDTDGDNVSDYDEVRKYNLDPLKEDTNDDGINDYEVVELLKKFNLTNPNEVTKDTKFLQDLSRDNFDESLYMDNIVSVSIKSECYGLIDNHIKVKESKAQFIDGKNSILGRVCLIKSDYEDIPLTITFDIKNYNLKAKYLKVATYDEKGHVKLFNTILDGDNISAEVKNGYAFVIDECRYVEDILAYKKDNWK